MRVIDFFDQGLARDPSAPCVSNGARSWTYAETNILTHRIALALHGAGIAPGDTVAVFSPNDPMGFTTMLGLYRANAVWAPLNPRNPITDNIHILNASDVRWLFYHSDFEGLIPQVVAETTTLHGCVCIDRPGKTWPALDDWIDGHHGIAPDPTEDPDAIFGLLPTGGTTGQPKMVQLSNRTIETMIATYLTLLNDDGEAPRHLVVAPMTHAAGLTTFPLLAQGGVQIFLAKADPGVILKTIEAQSITHLFLPPTVIYMMLAHPNIGEHDYSSLRYFLYAAAPMAVEKLREAMEMFGDVMTQTYGQAEAPMICTHMSAADHRAALDTGKTERLASCGRPTPYTRLAIMGDDGRLLANGENGEIVVRGTMVMSGYRDDPEATAEVSTFGWHHTGDIGYVDDDGFVYIVDRKKDMIISGGFNVFPSEIEQVLWTHPDVQDCAVIGVPDDKWGEAVKAVIETKPGANIDEAALLAFCRKQLGGVRTPKSIEIWPELPRSPVGKVLKKSIRSRYWKGRNRAV